MDSEEKKRRQFIRVIIAEIGMVVSVAAIVVVAVLASMGFSISGNGGIEQTGLMQLRSLPTGASVKIDGNTIFYRTNLSRTLSAGGHEIELSRDGYDSWSKTIEIYSGMLVRVFYPRLFLQNRVAEEVEVLNNGQDELEFYSVSKSRNYILYARKDSAQWQLVDVRGDELKTTALDVSDWIPGVVKKTVAKSAKTEDGRFDGKIEEIRWSDNDDVVLAKVNYQEQVEWVSINLRNLSQSVNISRTFGIGTAKIGVIDGSASRMFILENRQLRRVNVADGVMSRVLLDNVVDFANQGSNVIYVTTDQKTQEQVVGVYRDDEKGGTVLARADQETKVQVALATYYGDDYMAYVLNNVLTVLYGKIPSYTEEGANLSDLKTLVAGEALAEIPSSFTVSPGGEYIVAKYDKLAMVTDLEMGAQFEYEMPTTTLRWFDASMLYAVADGEIVVWDFDGTNRRNLAESMTSARNNTKVNSYDVMVTANNRWLYYVVNDDGKQVLVREKIRD